MYDIQYIDIKGEKLQKNKGLQLMCKKKGGGTDGVHTCRLLNFKS